MKCIDKLKELPFINDLKGKLAKVYAVGGAVRDHYLGRESKDLDIMVCNISLDDLIVILEKYGQVDQVGKSYGILKWKTPEMDEPIDIGLPRRDRKGEGDGHKDIISEVDTTMSIEEELSRRDFTMNAMAISLDGKLIDPYKGLKDIKKGKVTMVNAKAFIDDPLRILRGIQFSARFGFKIEGKTKALMKENASLIKNISRERIAIELDKAVKGGGGHILVQHLLHMDICKHMTDNTNIQYGEGCHYVSSDTYDDIKLEGKINNLPELFWVISSSSSAPRIAAQLKCSDKIIRESKLLEDLTGLCNKVSIRKVIFEGNCDGVDIGETKLFDLYDDATPIKISKGSNYYSNGEWKAHKRDYEVKRFSIIKRCVFELYNEFFPKNLKELEVNGNDLLAWGYQGKAIGVALKDTVRAIMERKIENNKQEIKEYLRG